MTPSPEGPSPTSRRRTIALALVAVLPLGVGAVLLFAGYAVDPLWPAQDMPPALQARYARDAARAAEIYRLAFIVLAGGAVWLGLCLWLMRQGRRGGAP